MTKNAPAKVGVTFEPVAQSENPTDKIIARAADTGEDLNRYICCGADIPINFCLSDGYALAAISA